VREGYPPADREGANLRRAVRIAAIVPLAALLLWQGQVLNDAWYASNRLWVPRWRPAEIAAVTLGTVGCIPLPLLLFMRLRGLAKRARSAHLAEHCMIVGVGTSLSIAYASVAWIILHNGNEWFGTHWVARSNVSLALTLGTSLCASLFALWSLYLLIRFAVAFGLAARLLRRKWRANDWANVVNA
jgi:hypothetical protein